MDIFNYINSRLREIENYISSFTRNKRHRSSSLPIDLIELSLYKGCTQNNEDTFSAKNSFFTKNNTDTSELVNNRIGTLKKDFFLKYKDFVL